MDALLVSLLLLLCAATLWLVRAVSSLGSEK